MMKTIYLAAVMAFGTVLTAGATGAWSLDSCINHAVQHNISVRSRILQQRSAELEITEAKDAFLPQVSAGASQGFSFGRGLTANNTYANRNTQQTGFSADMSLPLFQGLSRVKRLDYAKANLRAMVEETESAKDDITLNVISQYLQVLYYGEIYDVACRQLELSQVELNRREVLLENGKIPELDLVQARSQVAQDELSKVNAANNRVLALVDLAQLLQLEDVEGFDIQSLKDTDMPLLSAETVYENALVNNHSMRAARLSLEAARKNISVAKTGYLPTLSFGAGLSTGYYRLVGEENTPFHRQMSTNFTKSLSFSLRIPLFDAFSTRNSVRRARIQEFNSRLQLDDARQRLYKAIQQAYYQATAADKRREAAGVALEATKEALSAMTEKYNFGRANATEFEEAKTNYIRAASELVQAKYEAMLRMRILEFYNKN